jgi:FMN phosphatase YigB (HAD superfamily)
MRERTQVPIEAFLFDMGDVLIKFSHARMFAQLAPLLGRTAEEVQLGFHVSGMHVGYDRGDFDDEEMFRRISTLSDRSLDRAEVWRAMSDIFEPSPGLFELLTELKKQGFRMVLLSNTCKPHVEWVRERFPIYGLLDDYTLSFEVGAVKPEAKIFEAAIAKAGVPAERCFYTDDIPAYVEAGRAMGLQAEVFVGVEELRRQLQERGIAVGG